jgi:excisionase family DNA binding protein
MTEGDYYTVSQAAKVLKVTTGRVRQMLGSGELIGEKDDNGRWRIPAHLVHDRPRPPRVERKSASPAFPTDTPTQATESPERTSELESEVYESLDTGSDSQRAV